jgi:hypothetical protein
MDGRLILDSDFKRVHAYEYITMDSSTHMLRESDFFELPEELATVRSVLADADSRDGGEEEPHPRLVAEVKNTSPTRGRLRICLPL